MHLLIMEGWLSNFCFGFLSQINDSDKQNGNELHCNVFLCSNYGCMETIVNKNSVKTLLYENNKFC